MDGWDESMATGNELIDTQHREVVRLLAVVRSSHLGPEDKGLEALDTVMDFVATHFLAEEGLMEEVAYPPAPTAQMIQQHAEFTDHARRRVLEFRIGNEASLLTLHSYLFDWLTVHEFGMDRLLADWIHAHDDGPLPS